MGKTIRKSKWSGHGKHRDIVIFDAIVKEYSDKCLHGHWIPKTKEEYDRDYAVAKLQYDRDLVSYEKEVACWGNSFKRKPYLSVAKTKWAIYTQSFEDFYKEVYAEEAAYYDKYHRDGKYSESGRKAAYRNACARQIRASNRMNMHKVLVDEDLIWKDRKDGKFLVWHFW